MTPFDKFSATRRELSAALIEREQEIDLVLTALACQEHVLLVGPPGTGKSMLADALVSWLHGERFSVLVTKFTTPEEIFGPISVAGLKTDSYRRIVTGKLPTSDVAFVDEVFKASSAILNTLLQILNERTFRNDSALLQCPLKLCVGASNEWPNSQDGGKELDALFDRFLFRKSVRPIATEKGVSSLLWAADLAPKLSTSLSCDELAAASREISALLWQDDAKECFGTIRREAKSEGIQPGDRRLRKSVMAVQANAWLNGATEVEPEHLEILSHVLWDDPAEQPRKLAEIVSKNANPAGHKLNSLLMEAEQVIAATNPKEVQQAAISVKKLAEIEKQLKAITGTRADQAREYVRGESKRIKLALIE